MRLFPNNIRLINHRQSGFTLLELILVVSILAVIASMSIALVDEKDQQWRWQQSNEKLQLYQQAVIEQVQMNGSYQVCGFVADNGLLPNLHTYLPTQLLNPDASLINQLWQPYQAFIPTLQYQAANGDSLLLEGDPVFKGFRPPYILSGLDSQQQLKDGWGRDFQFAAAVAAANGSGSSSDSGSSSGSSSIEPVSSLQVGYLNQQQDQLQNYIQLNSSHWALPVQAHQVQWQIQGLAATGSANASSSSSSSSSSSPNTNACQDSSGAAVSKDYVVVLLQFNNQLDANSAAADYWQAWAQAFTGNGVSKQWCKLQAADLALLVGAGSSSTASSITSADAQLLALGQHPWWLLKNASLSIETVSSSTAASELPRCQLQGDQASIISQSMLQSLAFTEPSINVQRQCQQDLL